MTEQRDEKDKELSEEKRAFLEKKKRDAELKEKSYQRRVLINDWAKQPVNFIAFILLFIFMLIIIVSYILKPPVPMPPTQQREPGNTNTQQGEQKK